MKIFITGATGFIGQKLCRALIERGDDVIAVSRNQVKAKEKLGTQATIVEADITMAGDWQKALDGVDAVVNLAGESMASGRWNAQRRQIIRDSRVDVTRNVVSAVAELPSDKRPAALINASGIDAYAFAADMAALGFAPEATSEDATEEPATEDYPLGDHFLAKVCKDWEAEANGAKALGVRVAILRFGIVLGHGGGALEKLLPLFKVGGGGVLGTGQQIFSWIHVDDLVRVILFSLDEPEFDGPTNTVAPEIVTNRTFTKTLGAALGRPTIFKVPSFALNLAVGDFAEYLLNGRPAVPANLQNAGFQFSYPTLKRALDEIVGGS